VFDVADFWLIFSILANVWLFHLLLGGPWVALAGFGLEIIPKTIAFTLPNHSPIDVT
jgi:hypothetical protein